MARRMTPSQADRLAQVVEMRRQRLTQDEIARRLGISQPRVSQLYSKALAMIPAAHVEEARAEELLLIEDALSALLVIARDEHTSPRTKVEAWTGARGWSERRSKLLGLDAPDRHEYLAISEIDRQLEELKLEMALQDDAGLPLAN
jgi:transcriptional regulator with XRE-family HTH domain